MTLTTGISRLTLAGIALCGSALMLQAASVPIENGGFENYGAIGDGTTGAGWGSFSGAAGGSIVTALTLNDEFYTSPASFGTGWVNNGTQPSNGKYGLQHPSNSQQPHEVDATLSGPFEGYFLGFVNLDEDDAVGASSASIQSAILGQIGAGDYTLSLAVGTRPQASWNDTSYTISLVANPTVSGVGSSGGTVLGTPASVTVIPSTSTLGSTSQELIYNLTINTGDSLIGSDYAIRIDVANTGLRDGVASPNGINDFTQANFDNAQLGFIPVPEPGSFALLGLGALVFGVLRRRN